MKIAMTDAETTGLDPRKHEIIEIGLVVFESEAPFTIMDTLDIKVKPEHIETASPEALRINGYKEEDWKDAVSIDEAMEMYRSKARGCIFAAHNVIFDYSFIGPAPKKFDDFDRHKIDTFSLAWAKIPHDKMKYWSLKSICEYLNISPEPEIHRAINGAMSAYRVYVELMRMPSPLF